MKPPVTSSWGPGYRQHMLDVIRILKCDNYYHLVIIFNPVCFDRSLNIEVVFIKFVD
jgi:hypothetical protein